MPPARIDADPDHGLLARVVRDPGILRSLDPVQFVAAMDAAEQARLLGWLQLRIEEGLVPAVVPSWLADRLTTARALANEYDRAVRWEINRLRRAFQSTGIQWVLLKGAAYLAAGLPAGRGRNVADIDVLVPHTSLGEAEAAVRDHGWQVPPLDPYDERYYREWMHELPPMVHRDRGSVLDLHHAILPRTARLRPSSERLLAGSVIVAPGVRTLRPSHMILHAAAHLFHDGEITGAIRDLVDLDGLLRCFGTAERFWTDLLDAAPQLDLTRPTFYAVRYARRFFDTPIPDSVMAEVNTWGPNRGVRQLMDRLVLRALPGAAGPGSSNAALALYVRAHWLRMPPLMLTRHLTRKALGPERSG